jgi:hypothetical protein
VNPALDAVGTADAVLDVEGVIRGIAIEKDQGAVIVIGMDSIEPGMSMGVEALAGAPPNFFIGRANVKDALLDDVDKPEDIGESSSDLLKRFAGNVCGALGVDAVADFFMQGIDSLLKECGLFVDDGLHYGMEAEEFLLNAAPFIDSGGDHQGHATSDTDKAAEQEGPIATSGKRTETGERAPNSESAENEIGACGLKRTKTEGGPDGKRKTKKGEAIPLRPEKRGRTKDKNAKSAEAGEEKEQLEKLRERGAVARTSEDQDDKGSDRESAEDIANPPGEPDSAKIAPAGETRVADDTNTDAGTDGGGEKTSKTDEAKNVFRPVERFGAVGELVDEVGAGESLEGVADGDASGDDDGGVDVVIDEKGASQNSGPSAIAEKKKSSDGNASGCPENGGMRIDAGQTETEPAGSVIDESEKEECGEMREERGE